MTQKPSCQYSGTTTSGGGALAALSAHVERVAEATEVLDVHLPDWDDYRPDFLAGVPLLSSAAAGIDVEPGGRMAAALLERLAAGPSPEWLVAEARALDADLRRAPMASRRIADFLLGDETIAPSSPGLLRYLAWTAMARFLRPVVMAFAAWRSEDRWLRLISSQPAVSAASWYPLAAT